MAVLRLDDGLKPLIFMMNPEQHGKDVLARAPMRFDWRELSGSLGDLGVFLPLSVAMALSCDMNLGLILICAGAANIAAGWFFRQPIPIQPMKAIAAVAIAESLLAGQIAASGLLMGVAMLALAFSGAIRRGVGLIPKAVVRGIQLGVGLKLAFRGMEWIAELPAIGWDSWLIAAICLILFLAMLSRRLPTLLVVFVFGFALMGLGNAEGFQALRLGLPKFQWIWPHASDWSAGLFSGALPQLPLTLLNSVIAVCALSADYFPKRGVSPTRMAAQIGVMNLIVAPLGGLPMCHGAGGLAAQYRFGARTGGSVVMLGGGMILAGMLFGKTLIPLFEAYPKAILGLMIVAAGLGLAYAARDTLRGSHLIITVATAAPILILNTGVGFLVGCAVALALNLGSRYSGRAKRDDLSTTESPSRRSNTKDIS